MASRHKKMSKSDRNRLNFSIAIIVVDILLIPWLLKFPSFVVADFKTAPSDWFKYGLFKSILDVWINSSYRTIYLYLQLPVFASILSLMWRTDNFGKKKNRISDGVGGPEPAGQGQHGTSRWQSEQEMDQNATVWYTDDEPGRGGTIFGVEKCNNNVEKVWYNARDIHTLLIAITRFGKGRRILLPSIWSLAKAGESMVITDPKGEAFIYTKNYLKSQGYNVVCLNFRDPNIGNQWNILELVNRAVDEGNLTKATEIAWDIANIIAPKLNGGHSDPLWGNGERSVIVTLILLVSIESDHKFQRHMKSVYRLLSKLGRVQEDDSVPLLDYIQSLPDEHPAKDAFATADLAPHKMRGSFFSMVLADLQLFSDPNIGEMTAVSDHEFENIGIEKTAVFLIIPDEKATRNVLATCYIDQLYQVLVNLANRKGGRIPRRVNFLLDEFGNLPPIPDMESKITVAGGRGMRFTLAIQSLTQIKQKYKEGADTITGNCAIWLYFGTNDPATKKALSEMTGKYTVETENLSSSVQQKGYSSTAGIGLTGRALLTDDEIGRWDNSETLVFEVGKFPARYPVLDLAQWGANADYGLCSPTDNIAKDEVENNRIVEERWNSVIRRESKSVPVWLPDLYDENNIPSEKPVVEKSYVHDASSTPIKEIDISNVYDLKEYQESHHKFVDMVSGEIVEEDVVATAEPLGKGSIDINKLALAFEDDDDEEEDTTFL